VSHAFCVNSVKAYKRAPLNVDGRSLALVILHASLLPLLLISHSAVCESSSNPLPEVKPDLKEFLKSSDDLKIIWFGQRFQPPVLSLEELPPIDIIVISPPSVESTSSRSMTAIAMSSGGEI
jgi:hypothetical protein